MGKPYYIEEDLFKFGDITEFQPELGKKFFSYYNDVFKEGALTEREKALIALAVSHTVQCPYCIDAYTTADEEQMMEAIHVAAAIRAGASLVHGVQMMNKVKEISM